MTDNIPLTEFSSEEGLISPDFEHLSLRLPSRCLMAFLGEKRIAAFAEGRGGKIIGSFLSLTKNFPSMKFREKRSPSSWCRPGRCGVCRTHRGSALCLRRPKGTGHRLLRLPGGPAGKLLLPHRKGPPGRRHLLSLHGSLPVH